MLMHQLSVLIVIANGMRLLRVPATPKGTVPRPAVPEAGVAQPKIAQPEGERLLVLRVPRQGAGLSRLSAVRLCERHCIGWPGRGRYLGSDQFQRRAPKRMIRAMANPAIRLPLRSTPASASATNSVAPTKAAVT